MEKFYCGMLIVWIEGDNYYENDLNISYALLEEGYIFICNLLCWSDFIYSFCPQIDFILGREIEIGGIYKGVVTSIKEYGAFVEFNGGQQGLLHISELSHEPVCKKRWWQCYFREFPIAFSGPLLIVCSLIHVLFFLLKENQV